MTLARSQVALGILAGGRASRMGGADKALAVHQGDGLLERTVAALGPRYAQWLLSYNRTDLASLPPGLRVVPDRRANFPGPLAGIEALLSECRAPWLLCLPVDLECIPSDLFERLAECALERGRGVVVHDADGSQPLVALWPVEEAKSAVGAALDAGEGAVHRVQAALDFSVCDLAPARVGNLNTLADLQA